MTTEISAAGAVVWRPDQRDRTGESVEIALVHRPRYDDWSLPKGKLERGETSRAAAVREVAEETGFRVTLGRHLGQVRYRVSRPEPAAKVVDYYAARAGSGTFAPGDETDELRWLPPEKAVELVSYRHDERIVTAFTALPPEVVTVLLVRHAKAGSRADWHQADDLRPLSVNGRRQLPAITATAALYGADRVHAAPLVRCVDTVAPLAAELGTTVEIEPLLSEARYADHAESALARFLEIAAGGGTPVVCSQGGVIPDLVSRVAGASGLAPGAVVSRKASIWALFFTVGGDVRLVAADYLEKP